MDQVEKQMSASSFRRWMIQAKAGEEIICNKKTSHMKEAFLLAYAFEENRQEDKTDILEAIGGVRGVVNEVLKKVSSQPSQPSQSSVLAVAEPTDTVQASNSKQPYMCGICGNTYGDSRSLATHIWYCKSKETAALQLEVDKGGGLVGSFITKEELGPPAVVAAVEEVQEEEEIKTEA